MKASLFVAVLLVGSAWLLAQEPEKPSQVETARGDKPLSLFPAGYLGADALEAALRRAAAEHPGVVRVKSLAKTAQGRDVWLATLGRTGPDGSAPRPAILIVANLEADHVVGSQVALGLVQQLADASDRDPDVAKLLERATIHVVARLNPDGAERVLLAPRAEFRTNLRRMDRDRDGRSNEDGPDDLNGDGLALRMRAKDGKATLLADEKEPRILRRADPTKGERAVYSEYAEGIDNDGDGLVNEDPPGGVNLNRNWPHLWTEFDPETGSAPASEPEVRALIQFAFDHPEIAIVWSFGLNDNLRTEPKKPGSTLDDADLPFFAELSRQYGKVSAQATKSDSKEKDSGPPEKEKSREGAADSEKPATDALPGAADPQREEGAAKPASTSETAPAKRAQGGAQAPPRGGRGRPGAGRGSAGLVAPAAPAAAIGLEGTTDGALSEWAYHQFGAVGLASRLWATPEIPAPAQGQPAPPADGEARWLYWNDRIMGGRAFVSFSALDHPTLGPVQVGGWKPGVRLNPPIEQVEPIVRSQIAFLKTLAQRLPALAITSVRVERKGGGLFEVVATVSNDGYLPTALAQGVRARKAPPVLARLKTEGFKILAGKALNRIDTLAGSGGRQELRWLILAPSTVKSVTLEATTPKAGRITKVIPLD